MLYFVGLSENRTCFIGWESVSLAAEALLLSVRSIIESEFLCSSSAVETACGLQHTNDFALYTEAIKFFNHSESMVRIAVRTITLNVYRGKNLRVHAIFSSLNIIPYLFDLSKWFAFVLCVVVVFCLFFFIKGPQPSCLLRHPTVFQTTFSICILPSYWTCQMDLVSPLEWLEVKSVSYS